MRLILSFTTNLGCGNGPSPAALALYFTHFDLLKHLDRVTPHQLSSHTGAAAHFSKEIRCSALCCRPCAAGLVPSPRLGPRCTYVPIVHDFYPRDGVSRHVGTSLSYLLDLI